MKIKETFQGTGQVFRFTFIQLLKSRANRTTLIIALIIALAAVPVSSLLNKDSGKPSGLKTVYVDNGTSLDLSGLEKTLREKDEAFANTSVVSGKLPEDAKGAIGITLTEGDEFNLDLAWKDQEGVSGSMAYTAGSIIYDFISNARIESAGLTPEQKSMLSKESTILTLDAADYANYNPEKPYEPSPFGGDDDFNEEGFDTQLGFSVFLMMVCVFSISYIVRAVVEEKASKLVDLLMVSIKPGALMLGKVLAVLAFVVMYMVVLLGGFLLSSKITPLFMDAVPTGPVAAVLSLNLTAKGLLVLIITSAIGCLAFGILAALSGAGCSNMEESGGAMSTCMLFIMTGYMVSIIVGTTATGTLRTVFCLIPVLSMFVAPLQYMSGNIGIGMVAGSWVIQLACAYMLLRFTAKVYSSLIIYNGKRIGMGQILKMARGKEAI